MRRLDTWDRTVRVVLAFWGKRPTQREPVEGGVYKNLRLSDPIENPDLITEFEDWMTARGISGSTRNTYWSALSEFYRVAMRPRNRKATGVTMNPFVDIDRSRTKRRVNLPPDDLRAWVQQAAPHARLALVIGALASKLRLDQVLELDFKTHFDRDLTFITFDDYKGLDTHGQEQQITPVGDQVAAHLGLKETALSAVQSLVRADTRKELKSIINAAVRTIDRVRIVARFQ